MIRRLATFVCVALLQACAPDYVSPATAPCVLPAGVSAVLVAPAPGSTNNDTVPPQIIVATSAPIPPTWAVILTLPKGSNAGAARFGSTIAQTQPPFPSPPSSQIPSFANPVYYASGFNLGYFPLPLGTVVTVALYDTSTNCLPGVTVGTFTTSP